MSAFSSVFLKEELNGQIGAKVCLYPMILKTLGGNFDYILKNVSTTLKRISIASFCSYSTLTVLSRYCFVCVTMQQKGSVIPSLNKQCAPYVNFFSSCF